MKASNAEFGIMRLANIPVFQNESQAIDSGLSYGDVYVHQNGTLNIVTNGR